MKLRLYIDFISQPSRTVLAFCAISKIPVEITQIRVNKKQHLDKQFELVNPMKKVPAITDLQNGLSLGQSHAIMNYLMRKYGIQRLWGLTTEIKRAQIDQYLHFHHQNTRKCAGIIYNEIYAKKNPIQDINLPKGDNLRKEVNHTFDLLQKHYFKNSHFLIGDCLTPADLSAYFQIQSLEAVDYDLKPWKKIRRWLHDLSQVEGIKVANQNFLNLLPKIKNISPKQ